MEPRELLRKIATEPRNRYLLLTLLWDKEKQTFADISLPAALGMRKMLKEFLRGLGFKARMRGRYFEVTVNPEAREKLADLLAEIYRVDNGVVWAGTQPPLSYELDAILYAKPLLDRLGIKKEDVIKSAMRSCDFSPEALEKAGFKKKVEENSLIYTRTDGDGYTVVIDANVRGVSASVAKKVKVLGVDATLTSQFDSYRDVKSGEEGIAVAKKKVEENEKRLKEIVGNLAEEVKKRGAELVVEPLASVIKVKTVRDGKVIGDGLITLGPGWVETHLDFLFPREEGFDLSSAKDIIYELLSAERVNTLMHGEASRKFIEEKLGIEVKGRKWLYISEKDYPKIAVTVLRWIRENWKTEFWGIPLQEAIRRFNILDALDYRGIYSDEIYEELKNFDRNAAILYKAITAPTLDKALESYDEFRAAGASPERLARQLGVVGKRFLLTPEDKEFWKRAADAVRIGGIEAGRILHRYRVPAYGEAAAEYMKAVERACGLGKPHTVSADWVASWRYKTMTLELAPTEWGWVLSARDPRVRWFARIELDEPDQLKDLSWELVEEAYEKAGKDEYFDRAFIEELSKALKKEGRSRENLEVAA